MNAVSEECELTTLSLRDNLETTSDILAGSLPSTNSNVGSKQLQISALNVNVIYRDGTGTLQGDATMDPKNKTAVAFGLKSSDSESGIFSGESELCVNHELELDWYCKTEAKLICLNCTRVGSCQDHTVIQLASRAAGVRNQLVDVCEKMQLQALRIERFITQTLSTRERALQVEASGARERVVSQVSAVKEALEEEEQRLLEAVQREEERVEQCLLTQRAHWTQALNTLTQARTGLVHTLTHTQDLQLMNSCQEIADRVEEAEGVGEPRDTEQLNLNAGCSNSRLMQSLWTISKLLGPSGLGHAKLKFNERTLSPLLALSADHTTLTFLPKRARKSPPYDPIRFDFWPNALCSLAFSSGTHSWVVDVGQSAAYKVGVCYASVERKGSSNEARLGYNSCSWVLSHYDGDYSFCHAARIVALNVVRKPTHLGMLLDWPSQTLVFFDLDSSAILHTVRHPFSAPLLPACAVADQSITLLH